MLRFCRKLNEIIEHCVDVVTNPLLLIVSCYKLSIIFNNIRNKRYIFWGSILTPNTRNLSLIILYLKPKVVNVVTKTWVKPVSHEKCLANFSFT